VVVGIAGYNDRKKREVEEKELIELKEALTFLYSRVIPVPAAWPSQDRHLRLQPELCGHGK
jgi:hypothetical protein